jgi:cytochrome P450
MRMIQFSLSQFVILEGVASTAVPKTIPRRVPGPEKLLWFGDIRKAADDYLAFYSNVAKTYGDISLSRYPMLPVLFINHPDYIESVLVTQYQKFTKSFDYQRLHPLIGNGLLLSEGDFWKRQRKLSQPAFHRERIAAYSRTMAESVGSMLDGWRDGETCDIHAQMMGVTLDIVARCLFQSDVTKVAHVVAHTLELGMTRYSEQAKNGFLVPHWVPTPANLRYRKAIREVESIIGSMIERHRNGGPADDLLGMLLAARGEDGQPMTPRQLRDEVMTIFMAGHETTANLLSWTLYALSQNPEVERKLHEELDRVLGSRLPALEDVPNLRYTALVLKEGLRLYPPAWAMGRQSKEPFEVGGYSFPKNTYVLVCQWLMHRDPRFFPEPERFLPERWTEDFSPGFAYLPFGAGPRVCIGAAFANMEAALLLAGIAGRYRLFLEPNQTVRPLTSITLRPRGGIRMRLQRRGTA